VKQMDFMPGLRTPSLAEYITGYLPFLIHSVQIDLKGVAYI